MPGTGRGATTNLDAHNSPAASLVSAFNGRPNESHRQQDKVLSMVETSRLGNQYKQSTVPRG